MKVISGTLKGRKIIGFDINGTRPTMDRVKESLFAMINTSIKDSIVLDLFSGSGNLGIEAISEGAKYAYLVDNNNEAIKTIKSNVINFNILDKTNIIKGNFTSVLDNLNTKFDIIFLDPPYKTDYINKALTKIKENNLLAVDGLIVCESDELEKIDTTNFIVVKKKKYGDKYVVILK